MEFNKKIISSLNQVDETIAPLREKLNKANKVFETLEPTRKQIRKLQALAAGKREENTDPILRHFENDIIYYSEAVSPNALNFLRNSINDLKNDTKKQRKLLIGCLHIALSRERVRTIDMRGLYDFIDTGNVESICLLLKGNTVSREANIIITYLCVYIGALHDDKIKINSDMCVIRTNMNYKCLAMEAQRIIIRELGNGCTAYRITKMLKKELSEKYTYIPSKNTFTNWINTIKKHLNESDNQQ